MRVYFWDNANLSGFVGCQVEADWKTTYYIRDAQGNPMATYSRSSQNQEASYKLIERPIYGSSRVGIDNYSLEFIDYTAPTNGITNHVLGLKQYELSNHLGNVLTTISDKKFPIDNNGLIDHYVADITSVSDYYPFGSPMDGRTFGSERYRFGFNGQEKDDEVAGAGNSNTAEFWQYDSRLGRRWNIDPVVKPWESPYACFANNPILFIDPNGADTVEVFKKTGKIKTHTKTDSGDDVFFFVSKDKSGNIVRGEQKTFKEGTILDIRKGHGRGGSDIYQLRGDESSIELFEWYANNIKVEFSLFLTGKRGESGLNFITTSHQKRTERGARWLFDTQLMHGYTIREHIHNHPSNRNIPSGAWDDEEKGKAGKYGDVGFANHVDSRKKGIGTTVFKIYTAKDGKYRTYDKNTRHDKPLPKMSLPPTTIIGKKQ